MAVTLQTATGVDATTPVRAGTASTWVFRVGLGLLGVQFAFLAGLAALTYHRMTLGVDFGIFNQAWTLIGRGDLHPDSSLLNAPYLRSHFELLMWPLALLYPLVHSSIVLLLVQAAALAGTGAVVLVWVRALLRSTSVGDRWAAAVLAGTVGLLLVNPVLYSTATEDFHFEPLATCFVVLAAFDLWSGRTRRLWVWVGLCLLCGDVGGVYVVGLGVTGVVAARGHRWTGAALLAAGVAWVGTISALGDNLGSGVSVGYAYLAGRRTLPGGVEGLALVARGVVAHPDRPWDVLAARVGPVVGYLRTGGVVGVLTPWGFGVPLVALGTAALQHDPVFVTIGFQNFVVSPFVTFGTAWLVVWLVGRAGPRSLRWLAAAVGATALVVGGVRSAGQLPSIFGSDPVTGFVPSGEAAALRTALARTPPDAEVVAPLPTVGRFGQRRYVYVLVDRLPGTASPVPVKAPVVVVVIDTHRATELLPPPIEAELVRELEVDGARTLVSTDGVVAVEWRPPPGVTQLHLP